MAGYGAQAPMNLQPSMQLRGAPLSITQAPAAYPQPGAATVPAGPAAATGSSRAAQSLPQPRQAGAPPQSGWDYVEQSLTPQAWAEQRRQLQAWSAPQPSGCTSAT